MYNITILMIHNMNRELYEVMRKKADTLIIVSA